MYQWSVLFLVIVKTNCSSFVVACDPSSHFSSVKGPIRTSGKNWNCLDKIEGQILSWQIFVLSAVSSFKFSKQANSVNSTDYISLSRAPKYRTFRRDNGSRSNSRTCCMFRVSKSRPDCRRNAAYGVLVFTASISSKPSCPFNGWTL